MDYRRYNVRQETSSRDKPQDVKEQVELAWLKPCFVKLQYTTKLGFQAGNLLVQFS